MCYHKGVGEYEQDSILGLKSIDSNQIEARKPWFEQRQNFSKKVSNSIEEENFSPKLLGLTIKLYKQRERGLL